MIDLTLIFIGAWVGCVFMSLWVLRLLLNMKYLHGQQYVNFLSWWSRSPLAMLAIRDWRDAGNRDAEKRNAIADQYIAGKISKKDFNSAIKRLGR